MALGNFPYGLVVVPFSAAPTFDCSIGNVFSMTLSGNVTSITILNAIAPHMYTFLFYQDSSGLHSVAWPGSFRGGLSIPITSLANTVATQTFIYDGTSFICISAGVLNI
jgi:hypothetical protein